MLDARAIAATAQDLDVAAPELGRFEDRLPTTAARRAYHLAAAPDDGDARDLAEPERVLGGGECALLGAQAKPVTGIFHVGASHNLTVGGLDCTANVKIRVRRVGLRRGLTSQIEQLFIRHALVLKRLHGACASQPSHMSADPMKAWLLVAAAAASLIPAPALAWGKTGHRVVAAIADTQLSGLARAHVREILGGAESLDEAANWPDEMRSAPGDFWQKTATHWHYVTLNGIIYDHAPPEGDALKALDHFRSVLRDPNASLADKQLALRFIVHLVGDLHQPLHVGKCCDKGGNDVKVSWFGKPTNLHAIWDSQLVDEEQLSFTELAAKLGRHISNQNVLDWWDINPRDWISESGEIRDTLYPPSGPKAAKGRKKSRRPTVPELSYAYVYKFTPLMERRLSQAGVRLAAYLNDVFASPQPVTNPVEP